MLNVELIENVYFDTNILIKLPLKAPSSDFLNLKDICNEFGCKLFISDLVFKEYINYHKREVSTSLSNIKGSLSIINDRITSKLKFDFPKEGSLFQETEDIMKLRITNLGLTVVDKKVISYDRLEEIALQEISPWKNKGNKKAIRDSLILLSVLEHAKAFSKDISVFITEDADFRQKDFNAIIKSYDINLKIVNSLIEAENVVKESLTGAKKLIYEVRESGLKSFLETQRSEILAFVRKKKYNSFALASGDFVPTSCTISPISGKIEKINAIDYDSIYSARPPYEFIDKNGKQVKISFMVQLKFNVIVENYNFLTNLGVPLGLEGSEEENILGQAIANRMLGNYNETIHQGLPLKAQIISRNISLEGSVFVKNTNGNYEYSDLRLERVIT